MAKKYKRITKKELKRDRVVEQGTKLFFYIRKHPTKVGLTIGGILLISIAGIYFRQTAQTRQRQADFEFREAIALYGAGNITEAITRFEDISQLYHKTIPGVNSLYWLGNIRYFQGNYKEARDYFKKYLEKGKDQLLLQSALLGIGDTYLQENDNFSASQKYEELATRFPDSWLAPKALIQSLRCFQLLNQPDRAKSTLQKLTQNYPNSKYAQKARCLIINLM